MTAAFGLFVLLAFNFVSPTTSLNVNYHYQKNAVSISIPAAGNILFNENNSLMERRIALQYLRGKKVARKFFVDALQKIKNPVLRRDLKVASGNNISFNVAKNSAGIANDLLYFPKSSMAVAFYSSHWRDAGDAALQKAIDWGSRMREEQQKGMLQLFKAMSWISLDSVSAAFFKNDRQYPEESVEDQFGFLAIVRGAFSLRVLRSHLEKKFFSQGKFLYKIQNKVFLKIKKISKSCFIVALATSASKAEQYTNELQKNIQTKNKPLEKNKKFMQMLKKRFSNAFIQLHAQIPVFKMKPFLKSISLPVKEINISFRLKNISKGKFYASVGSEPIDQKSVKTIMRTFAIWKMGHLLKVDQESQKKYVQKYKERLRIRNYREYIKGLELKDNNGSLSLSPRSSFNLQDAYMYLRALKYMDLVAKILFEK